LDPTMAEAHVARGYAYHLKKDYDKAIADFDKAIRLNPKEAMAYNNRGNAWVEKRAYPKAIADYTEAIRLDPEFTEFINNRGSAYRKNGDVKKALADHEKAIQVNPKDPNSYNCLGWLWATYPKKTVRDGKKAVEYAKKACDLTKRKNPFYLDTLAAAYAEFGEFEEAIQWQKKVWTFRAFVRMYGPAAKLRIEQYKKPLPFREKLR